jgi:restriction alleviation protein Lar
VNKNEKPNPCPFCGSSDVEVAGNGGLVWVRCLNCEAEGPIAYGDDTGKSPAREAIELWARATRSPTNPDIDGA